MILREMVLARIGSFVTFNASREDARQRLKEIAVLIGQFQNVRDDEGVDNAVRERARMSLGRLYRDRVALENELSGRPCRKDLG